MVKIKKIPKNKIEKTWIPSSPQPVISMVLKNERHEKLKKQVLRLWIKSDLTRQRIKNALDRIH